MGSSTDVDTGAAGVRGHASLLAAVREINELFDLGVYTSEEKEIYTAMAKADHKPLFRN